MVDFLEQMGKSQKKGMVEMFSEVEEFINMLKNVKSIILLHFFYQHLVILVNI